MDDNNHELYTWQPSGVDFLRSHPGGILGDEQGLGKTVMMVAAAKKFSGPVLCVVRDLAKLQITQIIKEWDPDAPVVRCVEAGVFASDIVEKWFDFPRTRGYLLVHHEALHRIASLLSTFGVWEVVWMDEAHRISNPRTRVAKAVKTIPSFYKWATTGTIMDRSPADFWSILHWFNTRRFGSYQSFYDKYVDVVRDRKGKIVRLTPKNLKLFAAEVGPFFMRRTAEEVGMQEPLFTHVPLELYSLQHGIYNKFSREVLVFLERESTDDPIFVQNALQKLYLLQSTTISPSLVDVPGPSVKYDYVKDWLQDYPYEQLIVFTHNKRACKELASMLDDAVAITGDTQRKDREHFLSLFESGRIRTLCCVIDLAAESLSFPNVSNAIFLDIHSSSRLMNQAEMRIRRANSTKRAKIYYLTAVGTVDTLLMSHYKAKLTNIELVNEFIRRFHDAGNSH